MYKVDLHTHSIASPDGGLRLADYRRMLEGGRLDTVAITDHNTISFAQAAQAELGAPAIIIGEEITTNQGEIIGLFLQKAVPAGLQIGQAIAAIRAQHGVVYVPHPFETVRHGLSRCVLDEAAGEIDIIEIFNGRAVFQNRSKLVLAWAAEHHKAGAASSDAHGRVGWGQTASLVQAMPTRETLAGLLGEAIYDTQTVGLGALHPKLNRLKKKVHRRV